MEAPSRSAGIGSIDSPPSIEDQIPPHIARILTEARSAIQAANAVTNEVSSQTFPIPGQDALFAQLQGLKDLTDFVVKIEEEKERNNTILKNIDSGQLEYSTMVSLLSQLTIEKYKDEAVSSIIFHLLNSKITSRLQEFLILFPVDQRDSLLFEGVADVVTEARNATMLLHRDNYKERIDNFIPLYNSYKHILGDAVSKALGAYSLMSDNNYKVALLNLLFSSAIYFPELPMHSYPAFYISQHMEEFKLSQVHNTILDSTRQNYQAYLEQKKKDFFSGLDGRFITYYDYLTKLSQNPEDPASFAAASCREITDKYATSRKQYQQQTEDACKPVYQFMEAETARIKDEIINHIIAFHIALKDLNSLILIISQLFSHDMLPKVILRIAEISLERGAIQAFQEILPLMLRKKDQYKIEDRPNVDAALVRGAVLAIKSGNLSFASEIMALIPGRREEIISLTQNI